RWLGRWRSGAADGLVAELVSYCSYRTGELILGTVPAVLSAVSERGTGFLDELKLCRQQFDSLARSLATDLPRETGPAPSAAAKVRELYPGGARTLNDAADHVHRGLDPETFRRFDEGIQTWVRSELGGLWKLVSEPDGATRRLKEALREGALALVAPAL